MIDVGPLLRQGAVPAAAREAAGHALGQACREWGFFYVENHGVDVELEHRLDALSQAFFARPPEAKLRIRMALGGRAWRGYFPVGAELTSGQPDGKEGIYFGSELAPDHPLVQARTPMHGPNLFPPDLPGFRETVLAYQAAMTTLARALMEGLAMGLGLAPGYFAEHYTGDPLTLFRIFHYPPSDAERWGVGEHTDYGLLTILRQDDVGGLEIRSRSSWIPAPPLPGTYVCNLGDMLDRMTGGFYRSTPHRVRAHATRHRLSFPFFFDPNYFAEVHPVGLGAGIADDRGERWDRASVHTFRGTYGAYLLGKVARVFPQLRDEVL